MKKAVYLFVLLFVSLFANASETNSSVSSATTETTISVLSDKEMDTNSSEVTTIVVDEFCITTTFKLKVGSFYNMQGQLVDQYQVYVSTTCYFSTPPCSLC